MPSSRLCRHIRLVKRPARHQLGGVDRFDLASFVAACCPRLRSSLAAMAIAWLRYQRPLPRRHAISPRPKDPHSTMRAYASDWQHH